MAREHEAPDPPPGTLILQGHRGSHTDELLRVAQSVASEKNDKKACRNLRGLVRSHRPTHEFVWTEDADALLRRLLGRTAGELNEVLKDLSNMLCEKTSSLVTSKKWRSKVTFDFDEQLELQPFRTTHSIGSVWNRFSEHIESDEPFDLVIRGHLWVEAAMTTLVCRELKHADKFEDARLNFSQRLAVATSMGVIFDDEASVIRAVNQLRNRIAHSLDAQIEPDDETALVSACSRRLREAAATIHEGEGIPDFPKGIAAVIAAIVFVLHERVDVYDAGQRYAEYMHEVALRTLSRD